MKHVFIVFAAIAMSGCAASGAWQKEGVSRDNATTELSECRYQVGISKAAPSAHMALINDCMQSKGFRYR